jgi:hypothetical protein
MFVKKLLKPSAIIWGIGFFGWLVFIGRFLLVADLDLKVTRPPFASFGHVAGSLTAC